MKMEQMPNYADVFTLDEFIQMCKSGFLIDYDGTGYYATATKMSRKCANPSDIARGAVDTDYSHVAWFNK